MPRLFASMMRFSIWSDMPRPCRPPIVFAARISSTGSANSLPLIATGRPLRNSIVTALGLDRDLRVLVRDAHDRLDDLHRRRRAARDPSPRASRRAGSRRSSTPSRPRSRARGRASTSHSLISLRPPSSLDEGARRATACRCAALRSRAARSGRSARCRCPCTSSRRPRCRRRARAIACTSSVPVTARPSGVVLK